MIFVWGLGEIGVWIFTDAHGFCFGNCWWFEMIIEKYIRLKISSFYSEE